MKRFTATNGMFNYEVVVRKDGFAKEFKVRSTDEASAMYVTDSAFDEALFLPLGYYEAKGLNQSGFSREQINEMFNW